MGVSLIIGLQHALSPPFAPPRSERLLLLCFLPHTEGYAFSSSVLPSLVCLALASVDCENIAAQTLTLGVVRSEVRHQVAIVREGISRTRMPRSWQFQCMLPVRWCKLQHGSSMLRQISSNTLSHHIRSYIGNGVWAFRGILQGPLYERTDGITKENGCETISYNIGNYVGNRTGNREDAWRKFSRNII